MKYFLALCGIIFLAAYLPAQTAAIIDKVVANVGGEVILLSDIEDQYAYMQAKQGNLTANDKCGILENLLSQKLLVNQAKLDSIKIEEEELNNELEARIDQILAYMNNNTQQFIDYYGKSPAQVKEEMREDQKDQLLMRKMRQQIGTDVVVTPAETRQFFDSVPTDSLPYFNSEVELGEIVIKPKVNAEQRSIALQKINDLRKKIVEGKEDFAKLAANHSEDYASARNGGDLGFVKRGQFVPEFEAVAYNLATDEISDVVESEYGFHVIQLLERRGNSIHTRHILIKPQITEADQQLAYHTLDSVRLLLLKDSLTFSQAVKRFSDKNIQSYNNDGRMVNAASGNNFFEIGDLEPEVYFAVDTLPDKGITKPIAFTGERGDKYYRLIQLQSRSKPHRATLAQDYSKISAAALEQKKALALNAWLMEKIQATYIRVNASYESCPNLGIWLDNASKPQAKAPKTSP